MSVFQKNNGSVHAQHWLLDPEIIFLNHGSFGACPKPVLDYQQALRQQMEREPVIFLDNQWHSNISSALESLADFVGSDPDDLAFVTNATGGVNAVLRSLRFKPGDELLVTDHEYHACANALDYIARRDGAQVITVAIPFPIADPSEAVQAILAGVTPRTRLAMVDHITSPTALVLPIKEIVRELDGLGVDTLVDGAHAVGMLSLNLNEICGAYYTSNCHKWLCTPKGSAFLHVRRDRQEGIHPLTISHGYSASEEDRSLFRMEFDWQGTCDPTPWLCIPEAIRFLGSLENGGWDALYQRNHDLVIKASEMVARKLGVELAAPESMIGTTATLVLPDDPEPDPPSFPYIQGLRKALMNKFRIEAHIVNWPQHPKRLLRLSAHAYNDIKQYEYLGDALIELLEMEIKRLPLTS